MFLISDAIAANSQTAQANPFGSVMMLVGFMLIFYFMLWRPQSKRAKEHRELVTKLSKGDEVVTNGGLLGRIIKVSDDFVTVSIAEGIDVLIQKPAIAATLPKGTMKSL